MHTRFIILDDNQEETARLEALLVAFAPSALVQKAGSATALAVMARDTRCVSAIFIPARMWDYALVRPFLEAGDKPALVLLQSARERYAAHLFFAHRYCLQAPYETSAVKALLASFSTCDMLPASAYEFLLLKMDWQYIKIAFKDIVQIERKGSLTYIQTAQGKTHVCFYPLVSLLRLLPPNRFIQLSRSVVRPFGEIKVTRRFILIDNVAVPVKNRFLKRFATHFTAN